jgi:3-hydroxybutyryl-CoA dehydratase
MRAMSDAGVSIEPPATLEFDDLVEGTESSFATIASAAAIDRFAELSGDNSPLHVSEGFALARGFRGRVVHGAYLAALVSRLVGTRLPGANAILHQMQLSFHATTHVGDALTVTGRVERKLDPLRAIILSVGIAVIEPDREPRRVASGKVQVGFTASGST